MKNQTLIITGILLALSSCKSDVADTATPPTTGSPTPGTSPVETNPPNATYSPAFAGQTRAAGVQTPTSYQSTILTTALTSPWGITSLPDGRLLITEKAGTMRIDTTAELKRLLFSGVFSSKPVKLYNPDG